MHQRVPFKAKMVYLSCRYLCLEVSRMEYGFHLFGGGPLCFSKLSVVVVVVVR